MTAASFFFGCSNDSGDTLDLTPPPSTTSVSKNLPLISNVIPSEGPVRTVVKATIANLKTSSDEIFFHDQKISLRNAPSNQYEFTVPTISAGSYNVFVQRGAEKSNQFSFKVTDATTPPGETPPGEEPPSENPPPPTDPNIRVSRCSKNTSCPYRAIKMDWSFTNVKAAYLLIPVNYIAALDKFEDPLNYMRFIGDADEPYLGRVENTLERLLEDPLAHFNSLDNNIEAAIQRDTAGAPYNYCYFDNRSVGFKQTLRSKVACTPQIMPWTVNYMALFFPLSSNQTSKSGLWFLNINRKYYDGRTRSPIPLQIYYKFANDTVGSLSKPQPHIR